MISLIEKWRKKVKKENKSRGEGDNGNPVPTSGIMQKSAKSHQMFYFASLVHSGCLI